MTMTMAEIHFDILSYWHAGSGYGQGADLDAVVVRNAAGLPFLPGKTVKGLCREAVVTLEELGKLTNVSEKWFGSITQDKLKTRFETDPGILSFSSAIPAPAEINEEWAKANKQMLQALYGDLAATRIEDVTGLAADKSLRKIEVAIPLKLVAAVTATTDDTEWIESLKMAAKMIRSLGSHRRRGLGRVVVTVKGGEQ
jgi:CRISPR/Cas system CMR subunit Cmr4 (Cas7 group RAMP superfamily)